MRLASPGEYRARWLAGSGNRLLQRLGFRFLFELGDLPLCGDDVRVSFLELQAQRAKRDPGMFELLRGGRGGRPILAIAIGDLDDDGRLFSELTLQLVLPLAVLVHLLGEPLQLGRRRVHHLHVRLLLRRQFGAIRPLVRFDFLLLLEQALARILSL